MHRQVPWSHHSTCAGSCGRCYEVRCRDGVVLGNNDLPVSLDEFFVLEDVNSTVKDSQGRSFPGNAGKANNQQIVKCWNASQSVVVTIIDSCPAVQIKEGEPVPQRWCLGDQWCDCMDRLQPQQPHVKQAHGPELLHV